MKKILTFVLVLLVAVALFFMTGCGMPLSNDGVAVQLFEQLDLMTVLVCIIIAVAMTVLLMVVVPWMIKKGWLTQTLLARIYKYVDTADRITDIAVEAVPNSKIITVIDDIVDYAKIGVQRAEQLYKTHSLSKDDRKAVAIQFTKDLLVELGYEITETQEKIIDGSVEAAVYTLGYIQNK